MQGLTRKFLVVADNVGEPSLKIAFATNDGEFVNQHFGTAQSFMVYAVNPDNFYLDAVAQFECEDGNENDGKLAAKLEFLDGCVAMYCKACGSSAVKQLLARHIQPLKVIEEPHIIDLIKAFQNELNEGPSSWLARAIQRQHSYHLA